MGNTFKETIVLSSTAATEVVTLAELLGDIAGRVYTIRKILCEVQPAITVDGVPLFVQFSLGPAITGLPTTNDAVAMSPFKAISSVNPTIYTLDLVRMAKVAPFLLRPLSNSVGDTALVFARRPSSLTPVSVRITTWVHIWPTPVPTITARTVSPVTDEDMTASKEP
mgnify:CR=1 FL=1